MGDKPAMKTGAATKPGDEAVIATGKDSALLSVRDLCIWFGGGPTYLKAVNHAYLEIGRGEIVGLIGQSGSGKTTLAMGLLGLIKGAPGVWKGEATLDGKSILPDLNSFASMKGGIVAKKYIAYQTAHRRVLRDVLGRDIATIFQEPKASLDPFYTVGGHMLEALDRNRARFGLDGRGHGSANTKGDLKAIGVDLLHGMPRVDEQALRGNRPVDEVQVNGVNPEGLPAGFECFDRRTMLAVAQLGGDEDLFARNTGGCDRSAHACFVAVGGRRVDVAVTGFQRRFHHALRLILRDLEDAEAELGNADPVVQPQMRDGDHADSMLLSERRPFEPRHGMARVNGRPD